MAFALIGTLQMLIVPELIAGGKEVAKVIVLRGKVKTKNADGKVYALKKNDWLKEGAVIQTAKRSFAKLLFIDKSQMSLGPKSQIKITSFPKSKAGIISLMKGQLRAKVSKDYMNMKGKNKSKLFIKTKTAAMGVRGTDFQVNYNVASQSTSLVTFEGAVSMAQIDLSGRLPASLRDPRVLERMVSSKTAVLVTKGRFSGVNSNTVRPNLPVKISPAQFESMQKNDGSRFKADQTKAEPAKKYRNTVPKGISSKDVANSGKALDKEMGKSLGRSTVAEVKGTVATEGTTANLAVFGQATDAPPEGIDNKETGEYAPPSGGLIDTKSGVYVPPPPGSTFDQNTQVYQTTDSLGDFSRTTGEYIPPPGYELDAVSGDFKVDESYVSPEGEPVRDIASIGGYDAPPPPEIYSVPLPEDGGDLKVYMDAEGKYIVPQQFDKDKVYYYEGIGASASDFLTEDEIAAVLEENVDAIFDNAPPPPEAGANSTTVKFNFN